MNRPYNCLTVYNKVVSSPVQQNLSSTTTRTSGVFTSLLGAGRRSLHLGGLLLEADIGWLPSSKFFLAPFINHLLFDLNDT